MLDSLSNDVRQGDRSLQQGNDLLQNKLENLACIIGTYKQKDKRENQISR